MADHVAIARSTCQFCQQVLQRSDSLDHTSEVGCLHLAFHLQLLDCAATRLNGCADRVDYVRGDQLSATDRLSNDVC